jgi:NCK-associated protein 1
VVRKFPNVDLKSLSNIHPIRDEIVKSLSLYYYTFVDLLDFKDHVSELLTTIDACQAVLRIRIRIHMFLGLLDPDPLVRGMDPDPALDPDPDPSIIKQI